MGWKDAPVIDDAPAPAWQNAPLADAAEPPSTAEVALNAVPKGVANLLNTPITLKNLAMLGLSKLPGIGDIDAIQDIATHPTPNYPMQLAEQMGLVDPAKDPQTGLQRVVDAVIQGGIGGVAGPGGVLKNLAIGAGSAAAGQVTKEATGSDALAMAVGIGAALAPAAAQAAKRAAMKPSAKTPYPMNPVREQTLREAQAAGYVVQPSTVTSTFVTDKLENIAGKAAVAQEAAVKNQQVTNRLAARSIGLADDTPLTMQTLRDVREEASAPYREVANLSPRAAKALDQLQQTRFDAKEQWNYYKRSGNPEAGKKARELDQLANDFEQTIDDEAKKITDVYVAQQKEAAKAAESTSRAVAKRETPSTALTVRPSGGPVAAITEPGTAVGFATPGSPGYSTEVGFATPAIRGQRTRSAKAQPGAVDEGDIVDMEKVSRMQGRPDLLDDLRRARVRLAKTHIVEKALNLGDGNVSAQIIGRLYDQGAPLSGELQIVGKFAQAFPRVSRDLSAVPPPGVSGVDAASSAFLGMGGAAMAGNVAGAVAGGLPLLRGPARRYLTDPTKAPQQRLLASVNATLPAVDFSSAIVRSGLAGRSLLDVLGEQGGE